MRAHTHGQAEAAASRASGQPTAPSPQPLAREGHESASRYERASSTTPGSCQGRYEGVPGASSATPGAYLKPESLFPRVIPVPELRMLGVHEDPSACTLRSHHHSSFLCVRLYHLQMTPHASAVLHPLLAHALSCSQLPPPPPPTHPPPLPLSLSRSLSLSLSLSFPPPPSLVAIRFFLVATVWLSCDSTVEKREAIQRLHQSLRSSPPSSLSGESGAGGNKSGARSTFGTVAAAQHPPPPQVQVSLPRVLPCLSKAPEYIHGLQLGSPRSRQVREHVPERPPSPLQSYKETPRALVRRQLSKQV
jgi:hypothetical protein